MKWQNLPVNGSVKTDKTEPMWTCYFLMFKWYRRTSLSNFVNILQNSNLTDSCFLWYVNLMYYWFFLFCLYSCINEMMDHVFIEYEIKKIEDLIAGGRWFCYVIYYVILVYHDHHYPLGSFHNWLLSWLFVFHLIFLSTTLCFTTPLLPILKVKYRTQPTWIFNQEN